MSGLPPTTLAIPLAVAAVLLRGRARALGIVGTAAVLLPLAAVRLDGWVALPALTPPGPEAAGAHHLVNAGLVLAAAIAWTLALHTGLGNAAGGTRARLPAAIAALLVVIGFAPTLPLIAHAGPSYALAVGLGVVSAGAGIGWAASALRLRPRLARLVPAARPPTLQFRRALPRIAGLLLLAAGPHLHVALAGAALLLVLIARDDFRARSLPALAADGVALGSLAGAWWLLGTVAGGEGGWLGRIGELPLSPAAAWLLVPLLGMVLFRLAGAPPLAGPTGTGLAAAAGLLSWRVVQPALGWELPAWTGGTLGLGALGALLAGAARRADLLLTVVGASALLAGGGAATVGLVPLLLAPCVTPWAAARLSRVGPGTGPLLAATLVWACGEVLAGLLAAEVAYSVVIVAGAVACGWPSRG